MEKKLLRNETEYREWAWELYEGWDANSHVEEALGLLPVHECYDSIFDENGEWVHDLDEDGNVIPEDTAQTVNLSDWVKELNYPIVMVYSFEKAWDRIGDIESYYCDYVELKEFNLVEETK